MSRNLAGQWIGRSTGDPPGLIVFDIDRGKHGWQGTAHLFPDDPDIAGSFIAFNLPEDASLTSLREEVRHFNPDTGQIFTDTQLYERYRGAPYPKYATIKSIELLTENEMKADWASDIGTFGSGFLKRADPGKKSRIHAAPSVRTWDEFKRELLTHKFGEHIYRGQSKDWPLQTSFHRANRTSLFRYLNEDVPGLRRALSAHTKHHFDTNDPDQFGAFMALIQHHGYPTPLLDWTYSPFVAAWFALSERLKDDDKNRSARIFCINKAAFDRLNHFYNIALAPPHFSAIEPLTIENPRIGPQQGLLTLTNVNDIEAHLLALEKQENCSLIHAYDIEVKNIEEALNDLSLMGITKSTLFPSIDSTLHDMKAKFFPNTST